MGPYQSTKWDLVFYSFHHYVTLDINFYTYSPDFYLYKLEKSCSSFGVHASSWAILCTSPLEACLDLSLVIGLEAKKNGGHGSLGEAAILGKASTLGDVLVSFP